jgi:prophage maintenance system killer protein
MGSESPPAHCELLGVPPGQLSDPTRRRFSSLATDKSHAVRYLTFEDIEILGVELAREVFEHLEPLPSLQMLGGQAGADVLQGILELPRQTAGGASAYPTIFDKAAVLLRSVSLDHPFVDGNKRINGFARWRRLRQGWLAPGARIPA